MLANHFINETGTRFTIETIQAAVEDFYKVSHADLVSKSREADRSHIRVTLRSILLASSMEYYKDIGKAFNRDHSTIMHSFDLIEKRSERRQESREEIGDPRNVALKRILSELSRQRYQIVLVRAEIPLPALFLHI